MASRYGCTNADAVALRGCVLHRISRISRRSGVAEASGPGITCGFSTRHGFMGLSRRPQTRPTTLLRLRLICFLRVACRCARLSFPDQRCMGVPDVALLRRHLRHCRARGSGSNLYSRVCVVMTVPPIYWPALDDEIAPGLHSGHQSSAASEAGLGSIPSIL